MATGSADIKVPKFPPTYRLKVEDIYPDPTKSKIQHRHLFAHLYREGRLEDSAVLKLLHDATAIFKEEPTLLELPVPITICGDIHGQFYDLPHLFHKGGAPESTTYLFLGDYVDRGSFSIECILYLFSLKITYPTQFFMLRGNHESRHMTDHFTFKRECQIKYTLTIYDAVMNCFDALPLAALVNKQLLCMHGGLSPELLTLEDIRRIDRVREVPMEGTMCDLLWSDPHPDYDSYEDSTKYFVENTGRGVAYYFTYAACLNFLRRNGLLCIIRAHELPNIDGFRQHRGDPTKRNFPTVITLFSAPNYIDKFHNRAAVIKYGPRASDNHSLLNICQFDASPHPFHLPNFMDVFTWSIPFILERTTQIFDAIMNYSTKEQRKDVFRTKVVAVSAMTKNFTVLRECSEAVIMLKGLTPTGKLPLYVLSGGKEAINHAILFMSHYHDATTFEEATELDAPNERVPPLKARCQCSLACAKECGHAPKVANNSHVEGSTVDKLASDGQNLHL